MSEPVRGGFPEPGFYALPGIERARAYLRGLVPRPPFSHLVGYRPTQVGSGSATLTTPVSPWLQGIEGSVEVLRILIEKALVLAVTTGAPPASEVRTGAVSINQLRSSTLESEAFVARARTVNTGSTFTLAEVLVEDAMGRAVAHATGSFLIRPIDPPPPPCTGAPEPVQEPVYATPDPSLRRAPEAFPFGIWDELGGLSAGRLWVAGELPEAPLMSLLGVRPVEFDEGVCVTVLQTSDWLCSRSREVAPGVLATLAHFGLGGSALSVAPVGHRVGILEQSITLLGPVRPDGHELVSRGVVMHHRADLVVSSVEVIDADGNRVALGYQTAVVQRRRRRAEDAGEPERGLTTVLFTDIVGSTERAEALGDDAWRKLLAEHDELVRRQLRLFKGREVKATGDGFLATFDSPARAIHCARAIRDGVRRLALEIRAGLHTGECELAAGDVTGIAVHVAARVQAAAGPGEILVSSTVCDLVSGSGIRFVDRGLHELKGIEGKRQLFAVQD